MIPLRDALPSKNYPVVNHTIIGINVVVFLVQMSQGSDLNRFIYLYGLVPARYSVPQITDYFSLGQQIFAFLSFMFLHGGFWHLLGNMWSLYIFGDNVEDRLGSFRYLVFYLLCGFCSGLAHLILNLQSNVPTIGASGAIAGVMGAYLILYPHSRILTLIPIIIIPWFIEIPAYFFIGIWFVLQLINAASSHGDVAGIAWWAHIGGFLFGILFLKLFQLLPTTGVTQKLRPLTAKRKTPRLQVIQPVGSGNDAHLYGTIVITPFEAQAGSRKLVNIPWGFHKRPFIVMVPPGMREGKTLRLKGLGKQMPDGARGDLYLKVKVQQTD
jgi:membrane associated rhomboid family serine protease